LKKLILTDVDGVLLDWENQFHAWMKSRGHDRIQSNSYWLNEHYHGMTEDEAKRHVTEYNGSSWMLGLPPLRDARSGVARLVDQGYRFHAITSMGQDPYSEELRMLNLERVFGTEAFVDLTVLPLTATKEKSLQPYANSGLYWIEDKAYNARVGHELGLKSILMNHRYNQDSDRDNLVCVDNWNQICEMILG